MNLLAQQVKKYETESVVSSFLFIFNYFSFICMYTMCTEVFFLCVCAVAVVVRVISFTLFSSIWWMKLRLHKNVHFSVVVHEVAFWYALFNRLAMAWCVLMTQHWLYRATCTCISICDCCFNKLVVMLFSVAFTFLYNGSRAHRVVFGHRSEWNVSLSVSRSKHSVVAFFSMHMLMMHGTTE